MVNGQVPIANEVPGGDMHVVEMSRIFACEINLTAKATAYALIKAVSRYSSWGIYTLETVSVCGLVEGQNWGVSILGAYIFV